VCTHGVAMVMQQLVMGGTIVVVSLGLLARIFGDHDCTLLALHFTTPYKLAIALFDHGHDFRLVAPATAHELAPVHSGRRQVALSSPRPLDAQLVIVLTEIGRLFIINDVQGCWWLILFVFRNEFHEFLPAVLLCLQIGDHLMG